MKPSIAEDKNKAKKVEIEKQIATAKKLHSIHFSNFALIQIPPSVLDLSNLKLLDLGFNNIEELPLGIQNLKKLEQLHLNNNPLQYIPIEIKECKSLQILNLAHTQVKFLPREFTELKKVFLVDLTACPLKGNLAHAYSQGIVPMFAYLQRKYDRAIYRETIVKKLKEWVYMGNTVEEIQEVIQAVMDELKDVETTSLKKLLRNLQNIFNMKLEEVRASEIRQKLFSTLVKTNLNATATQSNNNNTIGSTIQGTFPAH